MLGGDMLGGDDAACGSPRIPRGPWSLPMTSGAATRSSMSPDQNSPKATILFSRSTENDNKSMVQLCHCWH